MKTSLHSIISTIRTHLQVWIVIAAAVLPVEWAAAAVTGSTLLDDIPKKSEVINGYELADVKQRLANLPLHIVEGIWEFASEGTLMAIERADYSPRNPGSAATLYRMVVVKGADMTLRPGTVMGYLSTTSKRGVYDARIFTSRNDDGTELSSPKRYTISLTDEDSRLTIKEYGKKLIFNWWRLLPYMYRFVLSRRENRPPDMEGCVRLFPEPAIPLEPRYL
ncbi:MAG: hypothetical protein NC221_03205 [Duncaniella sp.]|nr:hypothetical protein [Muribaculum sp.]MCM1255108.1 hypothetical protein [Duncaniella sp.]